MNASLVFPCESTLQKCKRNSNDEKFWLPRFPTLSPTAQYHRSTSVPTLYNKPSQKHSRKNNQLLSAPFLSQYILFTCLPNLHLRVSVVQWLGFHPSKVEVRVRFTAVTSAFQPSRYQIFFSSFFCGFFFLSLSLAKQDVFLPVTARKIPIPSTVADKNVRGTYGGIRVGPATGTGVTGVVHARFLRARLG